MDELNEFAKREGWQICTVFDNGSTKPYLQILGTSMSNRLAQAHVYANAKANSEPHIQAMRLVIHSRAPGQTRKKRK